MMMMMIRKLLAAVISFSLLAVTLCTASGEDTKHQVTGIAGSSVTIDCHLPAATLRQVEWSDRVHSMDANPVIIFLSDNNPSLQVDANHPNKGNFKIERDFRLKISNLNVDTDSGEYICRSEISGTRQERISYLTVGSKSNCSGPKTAKPNTPVRLNCVMLASGETQPVMQWFAGSDENELTSADNNEPGEFKRTVNLKITEDDDRRPFRCVTTFGDIHEECLVTIAVPHSVRNIHFAHNKTIYRVGDELKCLAGGNPDPEIVLSPAPDAGLKSGRGWKSFQVPASWEGQEVKVECSASNTVDGKTQRVAVSATFNVTAPAKPSGSGDGAAGLGQTTFAVLFSTTLTLLLTLLLSTVCQH